jgi:hypothetical protein
MLAALRRARRLAAPVSLAFMAAGLREPAGAADLPGGAAMPYAIHVDHENTAGLLRELLDGARERLAEPRCQQVLDAFADADGRPLRARLEETGQTAEGYLGLIIFYDGRKHPRCGRKGTLAVTKVGSRAVWVCPGELADKALHNPVWAEATIIHEALHTLGLGENPPSSREITSRVIRACQH